jgi:hypothetical protein
MLDLIVDRLLPAGSAITVVIDDTLFKRSGRVTGQVLEVLLRGPGCG